MTNRNINEELAAALARHRSWCRREEGGQRLELVGAKFTGAEFGELLMSSAVFRDCRFEDARLAKTRFDGAEFTNCEFIRCKLDACDFTGAILRGCHWTDVTSPGCEFATATWANLEITKASFVACNFHQSSFTGCNLANVDLSRSKFTKAFLEGCRFDAECDLSKVDAAYCMFSKCDLRGARMTDTRLERTSFDHCAMYGVQGIPAVDPASPVPIIGEHLDFSKSADGSDIGSEDRLRQAWGL